MTHPKVCAWVSRHKPTPEQRRSLRRYEIVQVLPPPGQRFQTGQQAWQAVETACGGTPTLVVAVLAAAWGDDFVRLARLHAPDAPLVRAVMIPPKYERWSGHWLRLRNDDWWGWRP